MDRRAYPNILLLGTLWGTNLVVSRFGVGQFDPLLFAGLRLALASVGFALIHLIWRRAWSRDGRIWHDGAILGFFGTAVPMTALMASLQYQSSGITALLVTTTPAYIVLLAHFFLPDEKLNRFKAIGVLLALGGALLLAVRGESGLPDVGKANPIGYLLIMVGLVSESAMAIFVRLRMRDLDVLDVSSVRLLTAALVVLPVAMLVEGVDLDGVDQIGMLSLFYAAIVGALAGQFLSFYITGRFGATAFSLTSYIVPPVAAITGVVLLGETITVGMLIGMALIIFGVYLINRR
jgi:drug/metabolite transporter (DMT)-like permease